MQAVHGKLGQTEKAKEFLENPSRKQYTHKVKKRDKAKKKMPNREKARKSRLWGLLQICSTKRGHVGPRRGGRKRPGKNKEIEPEPPLVSTPGGKGGSGENANGWLP